MARSPRFVPVVLTYADWILVLAIVQAASKLPQYEENVAIDRIVGTIRNALTPDTLLGN